MRVFRRERELIGIIELGNVSVGMILGEFIIGGIEVFKDVGF